MKKVTIKDVALLANVSTATVSNVMNNKPKFVKRETRERVLQAMKELEYVPNRIAKSLKGKESKIIGLIIPMQEYDLSMDFYSVLSASVEKKLNEEGYQLVISNSHEQFSKESSHIEMFSSKLSDYVDGLIIVPTAKFLEDTNKQSNTSTLPVVYVDRKPKKNLKEEDIVYTDNFEVSVAALEKIMEKGYKKIIFASSPIDVSSMIERKNAFVKIVTERLKETVEDKILVTNSSISSGYKLGEIIIEKFKGSAVFVSNNTIGLGIVKYLQDNKFKIPEDIALVIYDDFPWMEISNTPITSIKQPIYEMGQVAARMLVDKLRNPDKKKEQNVIKSKIIERKSL